MMRLATAILIAMFLNACAAPPAGNQQGFQIGSATSRNLFIDSTQFPNHTIKLRLRNSSGDPSLDVTALRQSVETGLRSAGYTVSDQNFGIVVDVNAFQLQTAAASNVTSNSGLGMLLGSVVGYESAKRSGRIGGGSGAIVGAVAGSLLEDVLRNHGTRATYLALCDVNIGVIRQESTKNDRFVIGGNKIERSKGDDLEKDTFSGFAMRETVRVAVYAGDSPDRVYQTVGAIVDRLGRVIANLL